MPKKGQKPGAFQQKKEWYKTKQRNQDAFSQLKLEPNIPVMMNVDGQWVWVARLPHDQYPNSTDVHDDINVYVSLKSSSFTTDHSYKGAKWVGRVVESPEG